MGLFGFFKKGKGDTPPANAAELEALVARLGDGDWQERLAACEALGALGPAAAAAAPRLQELIDDDNGDVCLAAAAALSHIERAI